MKKAKRTTRNWFLFAVLSYAIVSIVMGTGLALSPNNTDNQLIAFLFAFVAPFSILKQVFLQPGNGRMWMGLGSVALLFVSCLWVLSRYFMENVQDIEERKRRQRLEELRPKEHREVEK